MKSNYIIISISFIFQCFYLQAQVHTNFNNDLRIGNKGVFNILYKTEVDYEIPAKDISKLLENEKNRTDNEPNIPYQIAVAVTIDQDIPKLIQWTYNKDFAYGKFTIKLNGALSSSINFDKFFLPSKTEMYIYNENGNMITGPITEKENNPNQIWGSWVYAGSWLTIEIKTPSETLEQLKLHSNNIAYGYKNIFQKLGFGESASCEINIMCPLGSGWEMERNSVALGLSGDGTGTFSGSLIMNSCNTNRPYFLTADHVYKKATPIQNVTGWRFTFQYWSPTCEPSQDNTGMMFNGSTLRANWEDSDFCLVELNNPPPMNSGIHYAGWNRNTTGISATTIIHHPMGDVMKITRDFNAPSSTTFLGIEYWHLIVDSGTTEGGSSGGPYFDQNHRIIGQHGGIDDAHLPTCDQVSKYGGRFDQSWSGGGTDATRLSAWLDPNHSNPMTINTTNVNNLIPATEDDYPISGNHFICSSSGTYSIPIPPSGATLEWTVTPTNIATITSPNSPQTTLNVVGEGLITLSVTIDGICGIPSLITTKQIAVGTLTNPTILDENGHETFGVTACLDDRRHVCMDIDPAWGVVETSWDIGMGNFNLSDQGTCAEVFSFQPASGHILAKARNACGWGGPAFISVSIDDCLQSVQLFPNPATNNITLSIAKPENIQINDSKDNASTFINEVIIRDHFGNMQLKQKYNEEPAVTIDVSRLSEGIYVVEVDIGKRIETLQLMIHK